MAAPDVQRKHQHATAGRGLKTILQLGRLGCHVLLLHGIDVVCDLILGRLLLYLPAVPKCSFLSLHLFSSPPFH